MHPDKTFVSHTKKTCMIAENWSGLRNKKLRISSALSC